MTDKEKFDQWYYEKQQEEISAMPDWRFVFAIGFIAGILTVMFSIMYLYNQFNQ